MAGLRLVLRFRPGDVEYGRTQFSIFLPASQDVQQKEGVLIEIVDSQVEPLIDASLVWLERTKYLCICGAKYCVELQNGSDVQTLLEIFTQFRASNERPPNRETLGHGNGSLVIQRPR